MKKYIFSALLFTGLFIFGACSPSDTTKYQGVEVKEQDVNNIKRVEKKIAKLYDSLYDFDESSDYEDVAVRADTVALLDEFEKIDKDEDLYSDIETLLISNKNEYSILSIVGEASEEMRPITTDEMGYILDATNTYIKGFSKLIVYNFDDYEEMEEIIKTDLGSE